jgi:hypothetical protein
MRRIVSMKTKAYAIIGALALVVVVSLVAAQQQTRNEGQQPDYGTGDTAIAAKLEQLVNIRQKIFKHYESLIEAGRAPEDASAAIELAEARIQLALERGRREEILKEIAGLVAVHEKRLSSVQSRAADRVAPDEVDRAKASLIEAEVRLLKARR